MRQLRLLIVLALGTGALAASAEPAPQGRFTLRATVSFVVDGDTLAVRVADGRAERIRLIGIDTPEIGECFAARATSAARRLAEGRRVVLVGDETQATRDRYGRLLAYVWLAGGRDLAFQLIAEGVAKVYVYGRAFTRLAAYRRAEVIGRRRAPNVWRGCRR